MATFTAPRKLFQNSVARVCATVARRTNKDILKCVRVAVNGHVEMDSVRFLEENCTTTHHLCTDWQREGEASILVLATQLTNAAKLATGTDVRVEVTEEGLRIGGMTVPAYAEMEEADYPPRGIVIGDLKPVTTFAVDAERLRQAIGSVSFATDTESTRYALGGIQFLPDFAGCVLRLAATDSRRLAVVEAGTCFADATDLAPFVIPLTVCLSLEKSLDKVSGSVMVTAYEERVASVEHGRDTATPGPVRFQLPNGVRIDTDQVQGRFPNWQYVVPTYRDGEVRISAAELIRACSAALTVTNEESRGVDVTFGKPYQGVGYLIVKAGCAELGRVEESATVSMSDIDGTEKITVDPRYMLDFAKTLPKKSMIVMRFAPNRLIGDSQDNAFSSSPIVMTEEETNVTYIVMPLARDR